MRHDQPDWSKTVSDQFTANPSSIASITQQPFRLAVELSPNPILFADHDELSLVWGNAAAAVCFQIPRADFSRFNLVDFVPTRWRPELTEAIAKLKEGIIEHASLTFSAEDGVGLRNMHLALSEEHIIAVGESATHPAGTKEPTDALTGLPDRRTFVTRVQIALESDQMDWGVLFVDLNDFKQVNDQYGHLVGDKVLADFAHQLKASSRPHDLVVRYGGDEFLILANGVASAADLWRIADRISREVIGTTHHRGKLVRIGCTVGAAMFDATMENAAAIIAAADRDMYDRKSRNGPTPMS